MHLHSCRCHPFTAKLHRQTFSFHTESLYKIASPLLPCEHIMHVFFTSTAGNRSGFLVQSNWNLKSYTMHILLTWLFRSEMASIPKSHSLTALYHSSGPRAVRQWSEHTQSIPLQRSIKKICIWRLCNKSARMLGHYKMFQLEPEM